MLAPARRFASCGSVRGVATCTANTAHLHELQVETCHCRYCPRCARADKQRIHAIYTDRIDQVVRCNENPDHRLRVITLTTDVWLWDRDVVNKYAESWKKVSILFDTLCGDGHPGWSQPSNKRYHGEGFIACAEFGEHGHKLHFHILFFGRYIPQAVLSQCWNSLTGCPVVWIEGVRKSGKKNAALKEVVKYVAKFTKDQFGPMRDFPDPEFIARLAHVFYANRRVRVRGCFYGLAAADDPEAIEDSPPGVCPTCGGDIVVLSPEHWDQVYGGSAWSVLNLKHGNKFFGHDVGPPKQHLYSVGFSQSGHHSTE
jgi:hypothetical protein